MPFIAHWYFLIAWLFYAVLLVLGVWLVMWAIRVAPRALRPENALAILKARFARGEIDQEEYESRKAALNKR